MLNYLACDNNKETLGRRNVNNYCVIKIKSVCKTNVSHNCVCVCAHAIRQCARSCVKYSNNNTFDLFKAVIRNMFGHLIVSRV
ncbi:hypothetical protein [Orgyia pseudotsugata single capsid nuclopolyhedrovirus]|nr:hypothetical protein [Orgyia pseudotsugata single capsid nuclopolyhedrovirus]